MIRWKYLLPRLGVVAIAALVLIVFSSPVMHWVIVSAAQSVTGAKVDVGAVDASPWTGKIVLTEFQVADPREPMRNLLQADGVELRLNPYQLLHGQWTIERARLHHIQLGTPRTVSGALSESTNQNRLPKARLMSMPNVEIKDIAQDWIDEIGAQVPLLVTDQLETVQFSRELHRRWPDEFDRNLASAMELKRRASELRKELSGTMENPLRDVARLQAVWRQAEEFFLEVEAAKDKLHNLGDQFRRDRQHLIAAKQRDQIKIRAAAKGVALNSEVLSELLLGEQNAKQVRELVSWIRWFREMVPNPETDFQPSRSRGVDVPLRHQPKFVFRELELSGEGVVAGQTVHFIGSAQNISTTPRFHPEPTTFELRGQANAHLVVSATIDRRGPQQLDTVRISCPKLKLPASRFGTRQAIAVGIQPSDLAFEIDASLIDDQITAELRTSQSDVQLRVDHLSNLVGGHEAVAALNSRLGEINRFSTTINVTGTLEHPKVALATDLGDQIASVMKETMQSSINAATERKITQLQEILDGELQDLDRYVSDNLSSILRVLTQEIPSVADLRGLQPGLRSSGIR